MTAAVQAPEPTMAAFGGLGTPEIIIIVLVILLLFGGRKLPEMARGTGRALRIFKSETKGLMHDDDEDDEDSTSGTQTRQAQQPPQAQHAAAAAAAVDPARVRPGDAATSGLVLRPAAADAHREVTWPRRARLHPSS